MATNVEQIEAIRRIIGTGNAPFCSEPYMEALAEVGLDRVPTGTPLTEQERAALEEVVKKLAEKPGKGIGRDKEEVS